MHEQVASRIGVTSITVIIPDFFRASTLIAHKFFFLRGAIMNDERYEKAELRSFKPHTEECCKPCPKPPARNCLIRFTPLQADIFEELLDDLIASIQPAFSPPMGPLPSVFKVLQNLFKSMSLSLRDQADLFAATELPITAYEQSEGWSTALIAATQTALTELYALSLLACVSGPVKDGWVIRIREAETNLAGIENLVPPVIFGTLLAFNGGSSIAHLKYLSGLPNLGVIVGSDFISESIPVISLSSVGVSTALFPNTNYAFSMPQAATITAFSAGFIPGDITIEGGSVSIQAQLCRASPSAAPDAFFEPVPGAVIPMSPTLTGNISGFSCAGSLTGLNIPLDAEDRFIILFTASSTGANVSPTTISGTIGANLTLELPNFEILETIVLPFAGATLLDLDYATTNGAPTSSGVIGFGLSESIPSSPGQSLTLNPSFTPFSTSVPQGGVITSVAVYFGVPANTVITGNGFLNIEVMLYRFVAPDMTASPIPDFAIQMPGLATGTYPDGSPGIHAIATDLNIEIGPNDRVLLVFTASFSGSIGSTNSVTGSASGGIAVSALPNNQDDLADSPSLPTAIPIEEELL
ncbi:hypothetical protein [Paenibacillus herberti]|uniref:Uncharacterized protein n=1 Tax=Paenibacillus herberti TaxID=1619309 RepID=A0A229P5T3_9BACL|nr:hypothetical protein [Paenibacillus herberti]OXM17209.1 hypothetical protein CGZ75_11550 [Paenibacillus herberti]